MPDPFLLIIIAAFVLLFLMSGRTRKAQREAASFRAELSVGQEVMTGSGLFGTVVDVDGDVVVLETSPGVTTSWLRAAIAKAASPADHAAPQDEEEWDEDAEEVDDEAYDDEAYDDDEAYADEEYGDEEQDVDEDGAVADGSTAVPSDVEVPDDASSLTDGDERR